MPPNSAERTPRVVQEGSAADLRAAIEREEPRLRRQIAGKVAAFERSRPGVDINDRATEVLGEAVRRIMEKPETYDPQRSVTPWVMNFALKILCEQQRTRRRERLRQAPVADLADDLWEALGGLSSPSGDGAVGDRLDVRQILERLDPESRHILECHFFQGLNSEELAQTLGIPNAGAARTRLSRAVQRFRKSYLDLTAPEVTP